MFRYCPTSPDDGTSGSLDRDMVTTGTSVVRLGIPSLRSRSAIQLPTAVPYPQTIQSGSTIQLPTVIQSVLAIQPLAVSFKWTGSLGFSETAGGALAHVDGSHTTKHFLDNLFNCHWVDDHINVMTDDGSAWDDADRSLCYAMVAVLGADATNTKQFTKGNTLQQVLGLVFDSDSETVSVPIETLPRLTDL
ncbi:unnamed protein product [Phytophthora fragariaefolia]|uniref:Unnamed protein product n=1 Tax=Phytophthora fragariaefolia TaxID=1490495 RepID=A0A9W7D2F5_9STRA|nr:unnamed protein product [Phytophthora fragariaefolia]